MSSNIHFSSKTDLWATPQDFFDKVSQSFKFDIDVCATSDNYKVSKYYTIDDDGLAQDWQGTVWMNPPYGREIGKWVEKAHYSAKHNGATVVCLLPARTDTKWWHDYVMRASKVQFIKGRLKFGGSKNSAPFPSALVVFGGIHE